MNTSGMNEAARVNMERVRLDYDVNSNGTITSPSKFECEHFAAVLLWDNALSGFADVDSIDCDGNAYYEFRMSDDDMADYGLESGNAPYFIVLRESEQGFVDMEINSEPVNDDCDDSDDSESTVNLDSLRWDYVSNAYEFVIDSPMFNYWREMARVVERIINQDSKLTANAKH